VFLLLRWLYRHLRSQSAAPRRTGTFHSAAGQVTAAPRGPVALVLHQARYDLRAFLRNKQTRFFTLILPLLFLIIFVSVFGNNTIGSTGVKASTY
jgi:hypothetical protein